MSHRPRFTVIIACYQTAPYLPRSLGSVRNQTFSDFEAICYVEESTDGSLAICRQTADSDPRFKVATGPRSGAVATTRNYGIDHAEGEYLVVLDGDDWLVPEALEKLDAKLRKTGTVDVLAFAAVTTVSDEVNWQLTPKITNFRPSDCDRIFSGPDAIRKVGRNGGSIHNYTWLSTCRVDFLREHRLYQSDGLMMEDFEHTPRVWFFAQKVAYLDEVLYVYRRRPGSLTTQSSPRLVLDLAHQVVSLEKFVGQNHVPADILRIWCNQWLTIFYWFMFHPVSSQKVSDEDRRSALDILFADGGRARFKRISARASLPKRLAMPLVLMAAKGWLLPAKTYFRKFYYPLTAQR
ncbi:MAG: glycosyltransferase family 2 protein [Lentisphaeria bacterium]|nr:glycosyltransferase family 2 protein [Lentisphaeria bacterium]